MTLRGLSIALVGPLPPPEGGMANQTRQLAELLRGEGARVDVVATNPPYRPSWIGRVRGLRALFRLVPYVARLWRVAGSSDVFHVMANSGWSWHLFAAPAIRIARLRGVPVVVNYRGGEAQRFLERSARRVLPSLRAAQALAVPSGFLKQVFERHGVRSEIVPNIVDVERFRPASVIDAGPPHLIVARNLEPIYDIGTALRAFALIRAEWPAARLTVAGIGPERDRLVALAAELGIGDAVSFCGRLDRERMAELYRSASVFVNPSRVDNMPNSVLEAMASGVPVVTTDAGGVPFIVRQGITGLIVPVGDPVAMAAALWRVLRDGAFAGALRQAALADVQQYTWQRVRQQWIGVYGSALARLQAVGAP